jgi:hypothetical protein
VRLGEIARGAPYIAGADVEDGTKKAGGIVVAALVAIGSFAVRSMDSCASVGAGGVRFADEGASIGARSADDLGHLGGARYGDDIAGAGAYGGAPYGDDLARSGAYGAELEGAGRHGDDLAEPLRDVLDLDHGAHRSTDTLR